MKGMSDEQKVNHVENEVGTRIRQAGLSLQSWKMIAGRNYC